MRDSQQPHGPLLRSATVEARRCAICRGRLAGMCARRRSYFFSLRRKKVTQKRATPLSASPALRYGASCGAHGQRGLAQTRFAQTVASPDPPSPALLGADRGEDAEQPNSRTAEQPNSPKSIERFRVDRPCWFYPFTHWGKVGMGARRRHVADVSPNQRCAYFSAAGPLSNSPPTGERAIPAAGSGQHKTPTGDECIRSQTPRTARAGVAERSKGPSGCLGCRSPCGCAEERSGQRIRACDCLSAASLSKTPLDVSTAGCPRSDSEGGRRLRVAFL